VTPGNRARVGLTLAVGTVLILVWSPQGAPAAGIRDLTDGWLLGPAATAHLLGLVPTVRDVPVWLVAGHSRLYGLPELPIAAVTAGVRIGPWPGTPSLAISWQTLGQGLYRENERCVHVQWGRRLILGVQLLSRTLRTGGEAGVPERQESFGRVRATAQIDWDFGPESIVQLRLNLPIADPVEFRRRAGRSRLLAVQGWRGTIGFATAVDMKPDQTPTVGLEWYLGWGGTACGVRIEPSVGTLGPVFAWGRGAMVFRSSHLAHPQLGITHRFELGFGFGGGPRW